MDTQKEKTLSERAQLAFLKAILGLGKFLGIFWNPKSRHMRDFSQAKQVTDESPNALVPVSEFRDPDEDQLFRDMMMGFSGDCLAYGKGDGRKPHHEDKHWGYTKGVVEGSLDIHTPDALPEACQVGLFAKSGAYPVVARPNFLQDGEQFRVSRMSLKIQTDFAVPNVYTHEGTAHELDLLLSEGIRQHASKRGDQDGQGFFFRDARQMRYMHWFAAHPLKGVISLLNEANGRVFLSQQGIMSQALDCLYTSAQNRKSWDEKDYYSAGPYALGGYLVKYGLRARQDSHADQRSYGPAGLARDQGAWFEDWQKRDVPAVFDLCVQVAKFDAIRMPDTGKGHPCKSVMATEYADLVWDEDKAEFRTVGTLTLQPTSAFPDLSAWYFTTRDRWYPPETAQPYALRFNAWNTLHDMRPVGQLFRARKQVHSHHRETRLRHTMAAKSDAHAFWPAPKAKSAKPPKPEKATPST